MKILIDIGHNAHLHLFKHFAHTMIKMGHKVHFTVRRKEFEIELIKNEGFSFTVIGKHYISKQFKLFGLLLITSRLFLVGLKLKPDVYLSHGSMYASFVSFLLLKPHISLEDTGNWEQVRLYKPFTNAILTSFSFAKVYGSKQIYYNSYHELAYLHPKYYVPNNQILKELAIEENERYFIVRFVSWQASHDFGQTGLNLEQKRKLLKELNNAGKVFISSESKLIPEFEPYRLNIDPSKMHDVLAFAEMFVGEGATMASECAMLGVPSIYINPMLAGSIDEQQQCGLLFHFTSGIGVVELVRKLLEIKDLKKTFVSRKNTMLKGKINLTTFLVWFVDYWPHSFIVMKIDPDFQYKFQ
jgi:uncharacterized protein